MDLKRYVKQSSEVTMGQLLLLTPSKSLPHNGNFFGFIVAKRGLEYAMLISQLRAKDSAKAFNEATTVGIRRYKKKCGCNSHGYEEAARV